MSFRIRQNTASAAGASLMDMANFLRQGDQVQNAQSTASMNLVDEMAKRLLEQERQEKDAQAEADRIAADLANNENKAQRAHQAQERNAFRLQQRQYTGDFA